MTPGTSPGKAIVFLAAAVALACVALLVLFGGPPAPRPPERPAPAAPAGTERAEAPPAPDAPEPAPPPEPRAAAPAAEPEPEPAGESAPLVPSGIGLFPPRGTDPVKVGIVVPDDYELPEGYLRHYQATDDGEELPPILLFHPDYEVKGTDGRPLPLPPDRVVPPELAPPGLPIEMLEVPEPLEEEGDYRLPFSAGAEDAAEDER